MLQLEEEFAVIPSCMSPWMYSGWSRKLKGLEEILGN